jgi:hypothetical protein
MISRTSFQRVSGCPESVLVMDSGFRASGAPRNDERKSPILITPTAGSDSTGPKRTSAVNRQVFPNS